MEAEGKTTPRVYVAPIRVEGDVVAEVKYKVLGCPAAVATCSMMSELATGKTFGDRRLCVSQAGQRTGR